MLALVCAGCAPDAASTNKPRAADIFPANDTLTPAEQSAVLRAFDSTAEGERAQPLARARKGYRWRDVPGALGAAAGSCFLGVGSLTQTADEVVASLQMADGQVGTATVVRGESGVTITVSLGAFGRPQAEEDFAKAFHRALAGMAAVRRPQGAATEGGD